MNKVTFTYHRAKDSYGGQPMFQVWQQEGPNKIFSYWIDVNVFLIKTLDYLDLGYEIIVENNS
jgi:hypothetical protein